MAEGAFDRAVELVMDAGQTLLENGGEVFRVQQTMEIMAASLGVQDFHVYVLTNGIFASAHRPGQDASSLLRHVPTVSTHLGRVEAVNELSRELAAGKLDMAQAEQRLQAARAPAPRRPSGGNAGLHCRLGGVYLSVRRHAGRYAGGRRGGPVGIAGLPVFRPARHQPDVHRHCGGVLLHGVGHRGAGRGSRRQRQRGHHRRADGADPGVALTMGVRDILNGDYLSGSIRLLDALFIAGSIAGGVVLGWILARGLGVAV